MRYSFVVHCVGERLIVMDVYRDLIVSCFLIQYSHSFIDMKFQSDQRVSISVHLYIHSYL